MPDIFISYSRSDKDFTRQLVKALADRDYDVWVDFEDIPFGTDWWEEIRSGIESTNTILFIISPNSLESEYCGLELNYALKNNKRLVPLLYRQPAGQTVPPHISHIQWLDFSDPAQFEQTVTQLAETLQTDLDALRRHTRLLVRAREWEQKGHSSSLLLRGEPLAEAESLFDGLPLTDLQRQYIAASRQADLRRQMLDRFAWAFAGGLLAIAFWAFSTFRSDVLITPVRIIYTLALGQTFGLCLGAMAVLTGELPQGLQRWLPERAPGRVALCLLLGVLAWGSYRWFLENLALTPQDFNALALGGAGLAAGFIVRLLLRPPGWLAALLTAIFTFVPIIITYNSFFADTGGFVPLIFFDRRDQLFSIAIPMVALLAVGANAHALYRQARQYLHHTTTHEG